MKTSDEEVGSGLRYYTKKLKPRDSIQLVLNLDRAREKDGIKVLPLGKWLERLPTDTRP